ncbi:EamA family transporter [Pseudonocardia spinosispora]|uniref:EamA family transporter n=1 Tax=Pseudonocardia spinosispora TaxID=103441 RepID=UPI000686BFFA|nr:EamA family transporter [Pseudonocardia spinosispora]
MTDLPVATTVPTSGAGRTHPPRTSQAGPVALIVGGAFCTQFGAAIAASLFPVVGVAGAVALRLTFASVVLMAVCRPRLRGHRGTDWLVILGFGVVLAGMNLLFYNAVARIPLGAAVTIEVLGPLTLSVIASRRAASWLWAALALGGVTLLGRDGFTGLTFAGVAFAAGAASMWAAYILFSERAGRRFTGLDGLALAMSAGTVLTLPLGFLSAGPVLVHPHSLALGFGVAMLSSLIPYSLELISLRRIRAGTFGVLMSLAPAIAATAGFLVLGQPLTPIAVLAIALVIVASIGAVRTKNPS